MKFTLPDIFLNFKKFTRHVAQVKLKHSLKEQVRVCAAAALLSVEKQVLRVEARSAKQASCCLYLVTLLKSIGNALGPTTNSF